MGSSPYRLVAPVERDCVEHDEGDVFPSEPADGGGTAAVRRNPAQTRRKVHHRANQRYRSITAVVRHLSAIHTHGLGLSSLLGLDFRVRFRVRIMS